MFYLVNALGLAEFINRLEIQNGLPVGEGNNSRAKPMQPLSTFTECMNTKLTQLIFNHMSSIDCAAVHFIQASA